jgi:hypothetical protein
MVKWKKNENFKRQTIGDLHSEALVKAFKGFQNFDKNIVFFNDLQKRSLVN